MDARNDRSRGAALGAGGRRRKLRALCAAALVAGASLNLAAAAALAEVQNFGANPGNLRMYTYVPASLPAPAPLVVALHGCRQRAHDYHDETGWTELARRLGFALLLPEQKIENNARRCFNWFNGWAVSDLWLWFEWGSDQDRGAGEALSIKQMVDKMQADYGIDRRRIYVTGLSAGGAMTAVMLAVYPEIFAGGGVLAGVPYKCARTLAEALTQCGVDLTASGGARPVDRSPAAWARRVRAATAHDGPWPRVSIWYDHADTTVHPANARELMEQWTAVHGVDPVADAQERVKGHRRRVYRDARGAALVETYMIDGMDHGVPIEPGSGAEQCGRPSERTFAAGICASYYIARFWGLAR